MLVFANVVRISVFYTWEANIIKTTDPYDVVTWKPGRKSVSGVQVSYWQERDKKHCYSVYSRCLVFIYRVILLLMFGALVVDVLKQVVR